MNWHEVALSLAQDGMNSGDITRKLMEEGWFESEPFHSCYERVRKYVRKHRVPKPCVAQNYTPTRINHCTNARTIRFGIVSDTHICGKYTQLSHLNSFYSLCKKNGIRTIYHCGDITDGLNMRVGHSNELYVHGFEEQLDHVVQVYPKVPGIETWFITGNHDASAYKQCGVNIGKAIELCRPDMHYMGQDYAVVELAPGCTIEFRHPWDGSSYAISSKVQKIIDNIDEADRPSILVIGHYHKAEQIFYKKVHAIQAGCFQMTTPFERGKNLFSTMGGWIIEINVDDNGSILSISPTFIPFYNGIKEDYKSFV